MAAAALFCFADERRSPLAGLALAPDLLDALRRYHVRQYGPRAVLTTVRDWVASGGGRPGRVLGRMRLVGDSLDPHLLCFGPALNRRFFSCLARAHAVVPYRVEGRRVYVYDPNYPGDRGRFVEFSGDGMRFAYGSFRSREGWGIALVPASAVGRPAAQGLLTSPTPSCS